MGTVLENCTTEEQRSVVLTAKDIHNDIFPVFGGKCLSRKAVHVWCEKRGKGLADDEEVETKVQK
jgi:hypothetical protein